LINGCYNKTTGALRVIDPSKGQTCAGTEAALTWNAGIRWRGNWSSATAYAVTDAVASNGSSYVARTASTSSKPPNVNWTLLASVGATGASGPKGSAGAAGAAGAVGPAGGTGPAGPAGGTGPAGPAGGTGPAGASGPAGPGGQQGPQGQQGPAGSLRFSPAARFLDSR
jgi:hypothetical protein